MSKNIPAIRFEGFSDEWERKRIEEVCILNPKGILPEEFYYVDLGSVKGTNLLSKNKILRKDAPSRAQRLAESGDVFYQMVRPYQKNNYHFQEKSENYVFSTGYAQMRPRALINSYFLLSQIQNEHFVSNVLVRSTGTNYPAINTKDLSALKINSPRTENEQTQIGNFFQQLDKTISLSQQELAGLKKIKQGFLQKMFPKEGEVIPEIRFKDFKEKWQKVKGKKIFKSVSDKNHPELKILSASQREGMVFRSDNGINITHNENNTDTYKRVVPGQFVMHLRSFQGGFAYSTIEGITSPAYTIIDFINADDHNEYFWSEIFKSVNFIKLLEKVTYGIRDGRSISFKDFSSLKLIFPSLQEQTAIGNFFKQLDEAIALQEKEIELLKETKQAFLQKMFI